jgi:hypothetical protein
MHSRLLILFIFLPWQLYAQTPRTDSIKKVLSSLDERSQVNALNKLGWEYYYYWVHSDSALKYTTLAYQKAASISYTDGKAEALLIQAGVKGRLLGLPQEMEQYSKQAINLLNNHKNLSLLAASYYTLSFAQSIKGDYQRGLASAEKAKEFAVKAKDKHWTGWAEQAIAFTYVKSGEYWKSFPYLIQAQEIGKEFNDSVLTSLSLIMIARSYNYAGDPVKALHYYHQALHYATPFILLWGQHEDMAYAHLKLMQYDSAVYYQNLNTLALRTMTADEKVRKKFSRFSWGYSLDIQLAKQQYDSVLAIVLPALPQLKKSKDIFPLMQALYVTGKAYQKKGDHNKALQYTSELYQLAKKFPAQRFLRDANELLANTYFQLNKSDSAFHYFRQHIAIKDSMETAQYAGRTALYLAASEAESSIRLLQKDKEISLQQLALNKQELIKQSQLKNFLLAGFVVLLLCSVLIVRNIVLKRKHEKLRNEHEQSLLKRKAMELEMQALRAQMNPHFIFNCLSAIDNLIQTNQADKATTCLSRFAKLIRGVLDSSKSNLVLFQKDIETLKLYLEMEQFRSNYKFQYALDVDDRLMHSDYKVPPLIIQPFVENAIHHGLLNKQDGIRHLLVTAALEDEHIVYSVIDNGIGRKQAAIIKDRNKPGHQSYGIEITKERIHLHNKNGIEKDVVIADLVENGVAVGTKAVVRINCVELV